MKHKVLRALSCALLLANGGCAAVHADLHNPSGLTGRMLDRHMFDASNSKRVAVLRSALLVAMVARAGTVYSRQGTDNKAYVDAIADTAEEVNTLAGYVFENIGTEAHPCDMAGHELKMGANLALTAPAQAACTTYSSNFESDIPQLEKRVFQLIVVALPQDAARGFLNSLKGANFMQAAWSAAKLAFAGANGLHSAAAENRSSIEVQAAAYGNKCSTAADSTVRSALDCLGIRYDTMFAKSDYQLTINDDDSARILFGAVMQNIRDSCLMVPDGLDVEKTSAEGPIKDMRDRCKAIAFRPHRRFGQDGKHYDFNATSASQGAPGTTAPKEGSANSADKQPGTAPA